jgi:hypothetical protein
MIWLYVALAASAAVVGFLLWLVWPLSAVEFYDDISYTGNRTGSANTHPTIRKTRKDKGQKRAPYAKRVK